MPDRLDDGTALERIRGICLALPEAIERPSHGAPAFFVAGKRCFVMFMDNHHADGRLALWCAAPDGVQAMLAEARPERFFVPPYVGHRGWLGVRLDGRPDWDEVAGAVEDAYAAVAPKRLTAEAALRARGGSRAGSPRSQART